MNRKLACVSLIVDKQASVSNIGDAFLERDEST